MSSELQSCEKKIIEPTQTKQTKDLAVEWLKNIFKCKSSKGFCYDVDKENKICTKRFMNFLIDSNEIYGASNLTDEEFPAAEKNIKKNGVKSILCIPMKCGFLEEGMTMLKILSK